jgi:ribosomal protein S27AE
MLLFRRVREECGTEALVPLLTVTVAAQKQQSLSRLTQWVTVGQTKTLRYLIELAQDEGALEQLVAEECRRSSLAGSLVAELGRQREEEARRQKRKELLETCFHADFVSNGGSVWRCGKCGVAQTWREWGRLGRRDIQELCAHGDFIGIEAGDYDRFGSWSCGRCGLNQDAAHWYRQGYENLGGRL